MGGTFDRLHIGHERLLERAFEVGDEVFIGLTSQRLAQARRHRRVRPFAARKRDLEALLRRRGWTGEVTEIDHPYGRATEARYDAIVVSPETLSRTLAINRARRRLGLKPLKVFTIPLLFSDDGLRLSATRMATGEVDSRGRRRTPLKIAVGSENEVKVAAVREAFRKAFPRLNVSVRGVRARSGVAEQPLGDATWRGARARAAAALRGWAKADYGVGIEAGLHKHRAIGRWLDVQYVAVLDRAGSVSASHGGGFYYPDDATRAIRTGKTVSDVLGPMAQDPRLGSTTGAVGFLSRGALDRRALTAQAVLLALLPRIRAELYAGASA